MSQDKITLTEDCYPYSQAYVISDKYTPIVTELFDLLPHGSGIDSTWHITQQSKKHNIFECANAYSAMNENGYYCHTYDFKFKLIYNGPDKTEVCKYCNGTGKRYLTDFSQYHSGMTIPELTEWLENERDTKILVDSNNDNTLYFDCNVCHGRGLLDVHTWDIKGFSFYGQKENNCCGYDLIDYLYQTVELSIHPDNKF